MYRSGWIYLLTHYYLQNVDQTYTTGDPLKVAATYVQLMALQSLYSDIIPEQSTSKQAK